MKQRMIGGITFGLVVYLCIFLNLFIIADLFFLVVGIYELIQMMKKGIKPYSIIYFIIFCLGIISMFWIAHNLESKMYILILVSLTMLNDVFAYFIGKKIGKTHFSKTSPNKTIEGLCGGLLISLIVFLLYLILFDYRYELTIFTKLPLLNTIVIIIITLICSVIGDLLESKLKRLYQVKDSGTIIYGHGGILDRVDSWIFASIAFSICIYIVL
ncbi:MAG: phosphatidate cytidylyltransferase [Mycoplasmatales bacterium]